MADDEDCTMDWSAQPLWFYILIGTSAVLLLAGVVLTGINGHQYRLMRQLGDVPSRQARLGRQGKK